MYWIERVILGSVWVICFISIWFIPREKAAKASFVFLVTQFFTWITGLTVVEFGWIEYPVHEFYKANATSFSFEYFVLPITTIFFILYYPKNKSIKSKILYYVLFSSLLTLFEFCLEKYTLLIKYNSWRWYWTWITVPVVFYGVRCVYKWFYKIKRIFAL